MTTTKDTVIHVDPIKRETVEVCVLGATPLMPRKLSEKAARELLLPTGRKTAADRAASLKHDPYAEFADAAPYIEDESADTYLALPSTAFKGAMMTAALDMPGARKAQIGRLVFVQGEQVGIYGLPQLHMTIVRSADMNRTPDVRTRVIVARWAARLRVTYVVPLLNERTIVNILAAAGITAGVGDWRAEKGKGDKGQFDLVAPDDPEFLAITKVGRADQVAAMKDPQPYDAETRELLAWFDVEVLRRGIKAVG